MAGAVIRIGTSFDTAAFKAGVKSFTDSVHDASTTAPGRNGCNDAD